MNKLAIVGTHAATRDNAPWDDPSFDIWVFNESAQAAWVKRWDVCFQLHKPEVYTSENNFVRSDHWEWLQQRHANKTIYMQQVDERVPNCKAYPLAAVCAAIPGADYKWFKSTPAYAIALALYEGYEHIALYGLEMASNTEYGYQLPNFQFWVGVALGAGVKIDNQANQHQFSGPMYAYEGEIQIDRVHFRNRVDELAPKLKRAKFELEKINSRYTDALYKGDAAKVGTLLSQVEEMNLAYGELKGASATAESYASRDDIIPRQEYERKAAEAQRDMETSRKNTWIAFGECQYLWNVWKYSHREDARMQFETFAKKHFDLAQQTGYLSGTMRENMEYMTRVDDLIIAAGGQRTVAALAQPRELA